MAICEHCHAGVEIPEGRAWIDCESCGRVAFGFSEREYSAQRRVREIKGPKSLEGRALTAAKDLRKWLRATTPPGFSWVRMWGKCSSAVGFKFEDDGSVLLYNPNNPNLGRPSLTRREVTIGATVMRRRKAQELRFTESVLGQPQGVIQFQDYTLES